MTPPPRAVVGLAGIVAGPCGRGGDGVPGGPADGGPLPGAYGIVQVRGRIGTAPFREAFARESGTAYAMICKPDTLRLSLSAH